MITPIIMLALLSAPLLCAYFYSKARKKTLKVKPFAGFGLGIVFLFTAMGHFVKTAPMMEMLPPWVPAGEALVYLTGIIEIVIGVGLFTARYRRIAALAAIVTLFAFFPVNIYAALNHTGMGGHQWGPVYLWIRTPLQLVLIAWPWWFLLRENRAGEEQ